MMKNHGSIRTIDTVTKTHKPMLYRRVDHLKRMQDRLTTNMMMMQDLLAAHMMRMTSLANSSSPCLKFRDNDDADAYLSWVIKVDKIFRVHNYSKEKKFAMASLEFEDYANDWWEQVVAIRED
jgi:hypothetical protein